MTESVVNPPPWGQAAEVAEPVQAEVQPVAPPQDAQPTAVTSAWAHIVNQVTSVFHRLTGLPGLPAAPAIAAAPAAEGDRAHVEGEGAEGLEPRVTEQMLRDMLIPRGLTRDQRRQLGDIMIMFPEACPRWIADRLRYMRQTPEQITVAMFGDANAYDRFVTPEQAEINITRLQAVKDKSKFNIAKYIKDVPDCETRFAKRNLLVKRLPYVDLTLTAMQNDFPNVRCDYFKRVLAKQFYMFYPSYRIVQEMIRKTPKNKRRQKPFMRKVRKRLVPWPANLVPDFIIEYQWVLYEKDIRQYNIIIKETRARKVDEARRNGELSECEVCLQECIPDDIVSCPEDHPFCKRCVCGMLEPKVNIGVTQLSCLRHKCEAHYAINALSGVLDEVVFNRLVTNVQQEEMKRDPKENVKECPICHFAMVIEKQDDELLRCINPDCKRVSCLKCGQPDHLPLECSEVEKEETKMRTHIEEHAAQSLIKACPACKRQVFKSEGCDHMTCVCREEFCYRCGGLWRGQDHRPCAQNRTTDPLQAAIQAKAAFLAAHPELRNVGMRTDPRGIVNQGAVAGQPAAQPVRDVWYWLRRRRRGRRAIPGQEKRAQRAIAQRATREQRERTRYIRRKEKEARKDKTLKGKSRARRRYIQISDSATLSAASDITELSSSTSSNDEQ